MSRATSTRRLGRGPRLLAALDVHSEVVSYAEEPSEERDSPHLVSVNRLEGVEEGLGRQVFGGVSVVRQVVDVAEDPVYVSLVERTKGFAVALGGVSDKLLIIGLLEVRPTHNPPLG